MTETQTVDLAAWLTAVWDGDTRRFGGHEEDCESVYLAKYPCDCVYGELLARIAADRKILELHTGSHSCPELKTGIHPDDYPEGSPWGKAGEPWRHASNEYFEDQPCPTQRLLASPYKGREGWQEAWE